MSDLKSAGAGSYVIELVSPDGKRRRKFVRYAENYAQAYEKMCEMNSAYVGKVKFLTYTHWVGRIVSHVPATYIKVAGNQSDTTIATAIDLDAAEKVANESEIKPLIYPFGPQSYMY
jgi:hypothetical protein